MNNTPERRNIPWHMWNFSERKDKPGLNKPVPINRRALVESLHGTEYVSFVLEISPGGDLLKGGSYNYSARKTLLNENWANLRIYNLGNPN